MQYSSILEYVGFAGSESFDWFERKPILVCANANGSRRLQNAFLESSIMISTEVRQSVGTYAGGPLGGIRVVEFAGLGPAPFAATLLADMGADVIRIARPGSEDPLNDFMLRGRRTVYLDLKQAEDVEVARQLVINAQTLIEGFRPGVMERLGLGPDSFENLHPRLVYARMTGWGQGGPLADSAGHDINYIAITGALHAMRMNDSAVVPPLNLVGDFGGGALYLVAGILAALLHASRSGQGQVIDCAICDGVVSMMGLFHQLRQNGRWSLGAKSNVLDGGAPFYGVYACADGKLVAVGALEAKFYANLRSKVGMTEALFDDRTNRQGWPAQRERLAALIRSRTRAEWMQMLEGEDVCVAPVLDIDESFVDPHLVARGAFVDIGGYKQPAPAPRFSHTVCKARPGTTTTVAAALQEWLQGGEEFNPTV